ncbi:unnamed protein product, partial [Cladocopium goreaui]
MARGQAGMSPQTQRPLHWWPHWEPFYLVLILDVGHLANWRSKASQIPAGQAGFIVAIFSIGCILTSFPPISSFFLDELGRRSSILLGGVIFLAGCALQALSQSMIVFLLGRLVTGTSIGLLSNVVPLYQAEMAPAELRGTLTSMYNMMITTGIFVAALLDEFLVDIDGGWRTAILLQVDCVAPEKGLEQHGEQ